MPENCKNISVPLLNKEFWSQLNSFPRRGDLRMINLQKNLQKATVAITQNTDKLLCDGEIDKKAMLQGNLNALSFISHVVQEISTMGRAKIKPALSNQYAHMCELKFEHSKYLYGVDITKNISKAKDMSKLKKHLTKDYSKSSYNSNSNHFKYSNYTYSNNGNNNKSKHFLYNGRNSQNGPPRFKRR